MSEIIIGTLFAFFAFYIAEKDNKNSELYKLLHKN